MRKRIFAILVPIVIGILLTVSAFAQSPEKMSYQAVIRDASSNLVSNQAVGMQISIIEGSIFGASVYVEAQTPTTNNNGLASLEIGTGTLIYGAFNTIDWSNGPYFIKTETDPTGGTNYSIIGTSQLLSVPYALHAKTAETITGGIIETDPIFTAWDKSTGITLTESQITDLQTYLINEVDPQFASWDKATGIVITESQISDLQTYLTVETDPTFTAWDKSTGVSITESQISDLQTYLITEVDPQFASWDKATGIVITESQISDLQTYLTVETDPTYTGSQAANITNTDITNLSNLSGTNTGDEDGSETIVIAGKNVTVTGAGTIASPYVVNADVSLTLTQRNSMTATEGMIIYNTTTHKPNYYNGTEWLNYDGTSAEVSAGESFEGGIIAYVFVAGDPGYIAGQTHGLIVAPSDQSTGIHWFNGIYDLPTGATASALGTGITNTNTIIAIQGAGAYAAHLCVDLDLDGYTDWYLPSQDELNKLYLNRTVVGGFTNEFYWTSTELGDAVAWRQHFLTGGQYTTGKSNINSVRAFRTF